MSIAINVRDPRDENERAPAPWSWHQEKGADGIWRDWIADRRGNIVVEGPGILAGPRIVRAVNSLARRECVLLDKPIGSD